MTQIGRACGPCNQIFISNIGRSVRSDIKNFAARKGVSIISTVKPLLSEIVNSYPAEMKLPPIVSNEQKRETLHINVNSGKIKEELTNIAAHIGVDLGDLLKVKLCDKMIAIPMHMKAVIPD